MNLIRGASRRNPKFARSFTFFLMVTTLTVGIYLAETSILAALGMGR